MLTDKVDITCQFMTVTAGRAQQVNFTIPSDVAVGDSVPLVMSAVDGVGNVVDSENLPAPADLGLELFVIRGRGAHGAH